MIELFNDYYLDVDKRCYTIVKKRLISDDKYAKDELGYVAHLSDALTLARKFMIRESLTSDTTISLNEALTKIEDINSKFNEIINPIKNLEESNL